MRTHPFRIFGGTATAILFCIVMLAAPTRARGADGNLVANPGLESAKAADWSATDATVERSQAGSTARIVVGLDTGTSPQTRLPPKGTGKRTKRKSTSAGGRSPSHADLGLYHQEGMGHLPQREWFGVSPDGDASILRQMRDDLPPLKKG